MRCAWLLAAGLTSVSALLVESAGVSAQATVDSGNRYSNVGALMIWRVDESGKPRQLAGFASGTLIGDRVMVTAGHFTAPFKALGGIPATIRVYASFSPSDAKDPATWIPVVGLATHRSMPPCPPPPRCDPTDDDLVAPLEPGIADVGLAFLERAPQGIRPASLAAHDVLRSVEGAATIIVGYGLAVPGPRDAPPDTSLWDGKRRFRTSHVRRVVDGTWALWSIPSYVCHGDSGGGIFLEEDSGRTGGERRLVANVSDGGRDCRRQNNNNRLDTPDIQRWIDQTIDEAMRGVQADGPRTSSAVTAIAGSAVGDSTPPRRTRWWAR